MMHYVRYFLWALVVIIAGVVAWQFFQPTPNTCAPKAALIGGPFQLVDTKGRVKTDQDFKNKFMLVYFGYSYCPDICPTGLQAITETMNALGADAQSVQPLFISVDPERDTPEKLAFYMENFHPKIIALTGSDKQIKQAMDGYKVYAAVRQEENSDSTDYLIDHSSIIYFMAPGGEYISHFTHATPGSEMAAAIKPYLHRH